MIIERQIRKEFLELLKDFPVVCIIGPRQVGKTFFIKSVREKLPGPSVYMDLELPSDRVKLTDPQLYLEQQAGKTVILDEVQHRRDLFPLLRAMVDSNRRPGRFILLGSASRIIIQDTSESLAGRIAFLELKPFSMKEIYGSFLPMNQLWLQGGFPLSVLARSQKSSETWRTNFIRSYIERDLPLLGLQVSPVQLERLWRMVAHLHGQILNMSAIADSLGLSSHTAKRYIDFMENAFLMKRIYPFSANLKKRMVKSPKILLSDSGILHYFHRINSMDQLLAHPVAGHSWEGFVIQQIESIIGNAVDIYYYRTHNRAEIDVVLVKGMDPIAAIEIKLTNSPKLSRGNTIAFEDINAPANFIITPSSDDYLIGERTRICSLKTFIVNYSGEYLSQ
jgi:predicted AAA+ superfamily ATPase